MGEDEIRLLIRQLAVPYASRRGSTGVMRWGESHGISPSHLSDFMAGKRGPATSILDALGLEWRIVRKRTPTTSNAPIGDDR